MSVLNNIAITSKAVIMSVVENSGSETADLIESTVTAHEEPLPSFTKAFEKLPAVFCSIMELPADWATGLTVRKLTIKRTKAGTRSVIISCTKQLEVRRDHLHTVGTPVVQIEKASEGESGAVEVDGKLCKIILTAIHEAEKYQTGERSQTLLNFNEAKAGLNALADKGRDNSQEQLGFGG